MNIAARANALLEGWYLGQEGGTALADILFGADATLLHQDFISQNCSALNA